MKIFQSITLKQSIRIFLGLIITVVFVQALEAQRGLKFRDDYWLSKAIQIAQMEDKNIFIDTYTPWCGPCKLMDIQFQDPELGSYFNKNYINIKINMDSEHGAAIKSKYSVVFLPTLLIVDKYGNVKYASDGVVTSDELLSFGKQFHNEIYNPDEVANVHNQIKDKPNQEVSKIKTLESDSNKSKEIAHSTTNNSKKTRKEPTESNQKETIEVEIPQDISNEIKKEEKILYTQNQSVKDPDYLYNLTYLKLQLQDGTQWAMADEYLKTQKDWNTLKNMRFIYDFVRSPGTKMFNHLIENRAEYDILFGKNNVDRSISIMINMHLYQGYPRPTAQESRQLFEILDFNVAEQATYNYLLERYEMDEDYESFVPLALQYIEEVDPDDFSIINKIAIYYESSTSDLGVNQLIKMMEHAIEVQGGSYYVLYDTLAALYFRKGNKRKALESIEKAKELALNSGVDLIRINQLKTMILEL